jgi:formylglycine-generating enzyme required for sulfatase activity
MAHAGWLGLGGVGVLFGVAVASACGDSNADIPPGDDAGAPGCNGTAQCIALDGSGPPLPGDGGFGTAPVGAECATDSDCASGGCDYKRHCVPVRSCTRNAGGDTCGPSGNESCCTTIAVAGPNGSYNLDKYNITAGRFRAFIESTKGDVRGYVQAHRPAWFEPVWDAWLPNKMDDGTVVDANDGLYAPGEGQDGVYQQLGPDHYGAKEAGGNEGCATGQVGNARTYRLPDDVNQRLFNDVQQYSQDLLDQKPQQCTTFFMFAAFCAWDGGRLPTLAELDFAWNKGEPASFTWPWGNSPAEGGYNNAYPTDPAANPGTYAGAKVISAQGGTPDRAYANWQYNFWLPATIACINDDAAKCDYSVYIAPPGRMKGNGPFGHADLAGNVFNVAMPMSGTPGSDPTGRSVVLSRGGSWEVHKAPYYAAGGTKAWKPTNKYLGTGGRCVR